MLIFGKNKKRNKPQGNPPWLTWSVTLLIAYMLFSQYTDKNSQYNKNKQLKKVEKTEVETKVEPVATVVEEKNKLPDSIKISGEIEGSGEAASCGHLLNISYSQASLKPSKFDNKENATIELRSGAKLSEAWHAAFEGMKVGGIRQINAAAGAVMDEKELTENGLKADDLIQYKAELKAVTPAIAEGEIPLQKIELNAGQGDAIACNQLAHFNLILWGEDGRKLYDSASDDAPALKAEIGNVDYFYGLDSALLGMRAGGARTVIVPPAYAELTGAKSKDLAQQIKQGKMVVMQLELLEIN